MNTLSSFGRFVLPCLSATLVLSAAGIARASTFTVTLAQMGPDVVATGIGTIDLTGLSSFGSTSANVEWYPGHGILGVGPSGNVDVYSGLSGPGNFGPGFASFPSSASGDHVNLEDFGLTIDVPQGYISGASLDGSATFAGTKLASLGATPGTYTWTWDGGADSFVLQVPTFPVPEPGAWALMLAGLGLLGAGLRTSRRVVARL